MGLGSGVAGKCRPRVAVDRALFCIDFVGHRRYSYLLRPSFHHATNPGVYVCSLCTLIAKDCKDKRKEKKRQIHLVTLACARLLRRASAAAGVFGQAFAYLDDWFCTGKLCNIAFVASGRESAALNIASSRMHKAPPSRRALMEIFFPK